MRRLAGQVARGAWRALRRLLAFALGALVVAGTGFAVLAWWLAEHPIEMPWLASRIQAEASEALAPGRLRIGAAALAWDGFRDGLGSPIDVRLAQVALSEPAGGVSVEAPRAQLAFDLGALLRGHFYPRTLAILDARVTVAGGPNGASGLSLSTARAALRQFADAFGVAGPLGGLRQVIVRGARIAPAAEAGWDVRRLEAELTRATGGIEASAEAALALGGEPTRATLHASLPASGDAVLQVGVDAVRPTAIAGLWPAAKEAAARLEAPVAARGEVTADKNFAPTSARLDLQAGPGIFRSGDAPVALLGGRLAMSWSPGMVTLDNADLEFRARPERPVTTLSARGSARIATRGIVGVASLSLDRLAFGDLASVWPPGVADGARSWVEENVTGMAHDLHVAIGFAAQEDASGLRLTAATGGVAGSDLTVHWLRPIPPVDHESAMLRIVDADSLRVDFGPGQQEGGLAVQSGSVLVTGLMQPDQIGTIRISVAGAVPDALALLSQPRLHLLSAHPVPLKDPRGQVAADISLRLPLSVWVTMDQVALEARARLSHLHLSDVLAGRALDDGAFDLVATGDGLTLGGSGRLADIPARIDGALDFRAGPSSQVLQRFTVAGWVGSTALAAAGIDTGGLMNGPADLTATYAQRRSGDSDVEVKAGLGSTELAVPLLGWRKPPGDPATASARLMLDRAERLRGVEAIEIAGQGIAVRGRATLERGAAVLDLDQLDLGGTNAHGSIRIAEHGNAIRMDLAGARLDLSGRFAPRPAGRVAAADATDLSAWRIDANFGSLVLARGGVATDFRLHAEGGKGMVRTARLSARTGPGQTLHLSVTPDRGGAVMRASTADGGTLLRDLGVLDSIEGGRLSLLARYLDQQPGDPLSGVVEMDGFRVRGAPLLAKALQAVTLYGLVQAVEGPGMGFEHLTAPFVLGDGILVLNDARAFNPSLGLTAKGRIDFARKRMDIEGTIVPAYYLNTVLGRIPLVGRLFSPEKGGGVIAARYSARGRLDDPEIRVNPLSTLTPGFLRGLFGR